MIGKYCVEGMICILLGIGKGNVGRWLLGGLGVVLGWWSGGGPWFGGSGGCPLWGWFSFSSLRGGILRPRGPASPRCGRVFFVLFNSYALV